MQLSFTRSASLEDSLSRFLPMLRSSLGEHLPGISGRWNCRVADKWLGELLQNEEQETAYKKNQKQKETKN